MKKFRIPFVMVLICMSVLAGCATVARGRYQTVKISSDPVGALVVVDDVSYGETPVSALLKRKKDHVVKIEMPGYQPFEVTLKRRGTGWSWANLAVPPVIVGALLGFTVDYLTGSKNDLTPKQIHARLSKEDDLSVKAYSDKEGGIHED